MIFRSTLAIGRLPVVSWVSYMVPWLAEGWLEGRRRGPRPGSPRSVLEAAARTSLVPANSSLLDLACPLHRLTLAWLRPCISAKRLIETTGLAESG